MIVQVVLKVLMRIQVNVTTMLRMMSLKTGEQQYYQAHQEHGLLPILQQSHPGHHHRQIAPQQNMYLDITATQVLP